MSECKEIVIVYTNIFYDNLTEEEKTAFATLTKRGLGYFHHGQRANYLAITFKVSQVDRIAHDKGEKVLWSQCPTTSSKETPEETQ